MQELKKRLARLLLEKSYIEGEVILTSGKKSNYYFDCKPTALHPEGSYLIGKLFFSMLSPKIAGVAGMTLGGDPLVCAVTLISYIQNRPIPALIVRKKSKGHGTNNFVEGLGNFRGGEKIAILEDVITTGGSVLTACERIQRAGLMVEEILCVLDREEGGRENIEAQGFRLKSIFTRKELLSFKDE